MKPSFALTLANDSIGLLHRTPSGWHVLGSVAMDDPDLTEALGYLRRTALGLEPQGFATKLVIPNSEILYSAVHAPGPKAAQRRAQIAAALDGRTPYDLSELAFDWSGTGDMVQVAAVARETLAQAEGFAVEHGFNPVSFVAMPEPGGFAAEPWFGLTDAAPGLLAEGEKVVRDQDPIRIASRPGRGAEATALVGADAGPEAEGAESDPQAEADPLSEPAPPAGPEPQEAAAATVDPVADAAPIEPTPEPEPEPQPLPAPDLPGAEPEPLPVPPPHEPLPIPPEPLPVPPEPAPDLPEPEPVPPPHEPLPIPPTPEPLPIPPEPEPLPEPEPEMVPPPADPQPDPAPQELPPWSGPASPTDEGDQTQAWPGEADADPMGAAKAALAASLTPAPAAPPGFLRQPLGPAAGAGDLPPAPASPLLRATAAARAARDAAPAPKLTDKVQKALGKASRSAKGKAKAPVPRPVNAPPPPPLPPSASQPAVPQPKSEAEAMTVFGKRQQRVGGKPRFLGLALTGLLLVLLLLVAVWAATVLDAPQEATLPAGEEETTAALPADPAPTATAEPEAEAEPALETRAAAVEPEVTEAAPETLAATEETAPVAEATAPAPEPAPQGAAAGLAAATPARQPETGSVEELTLPLPDQALGAAPQARLAAASGANADLPPNAPVGLPAYGALYKFDADGNILPTPEGVVTPDGVRLVAGRPAILPPPRPGTGTGAAADPAPAAAAPADPAAPSAAQGNPADAAPAQAAASDPAPAAAAGTVSPVDSAAAGSAPAASVATATTAAPVVSTAPATATPGAIAIAPSAAPATEATSAFQPDATLARKRPRNRPAGLAPEPPAAADPGQEGALPALTDSQAGLSSRRPPVRPAAVAAAASAAAAADQTRRLAEAAAAAAAAASTAAQAEAVAALAPTRRPPARPANFSRAVETAVAASVAQPRVAVPEPAAVRQAPPTGRGRDGDTFDDGEPDTPHAAPSIPTRASVARQATVAGALNLGRTSLIGVFGASNSRYALVRESSGRLVRVKVGDRLDGGRVVAIGQSDLSYQRGGNTVRLAMPRT